MRANLRFSAADYEAMKLDSSRTNAFYKAGLGIT